MKASGGISLWAWLAIIAGIFYFGGMKILKAALFGTPDPSQDNALSGQNTFNGNPTARNLYLTLSDVGANFNTAYDILRTNVFTVSDWEQLKSDFGVQDGMDCLGYIDSVISDLFAMDPLSTVGSYFSLGISGMFVKSQVEEFNDWLVKIGSNDRVLSN